jgi:hypothetical protein
VWGDVVLAFPTKARYASSDIPRGPRGRCVRSPLLPGGRKGPRSCAEGRPPQHPGQSPTGRPKRGRHERPPTTPLSASARLLLHPLSRVPCGHTRRSAPLGSAGAGRQDARTHAAPCESANFDFWPARGAPTPLLRSRPRWPVALPGPTHVFNWPCVPCLARVDGDDAVEGPVATPEASETKAREPHLSPCTPLRAFARARARVGRRAALCPGGSARKAQLQGAAKARSARAGKTRAKRFFLRARPTSAALTYPRHTISRSPSPSPRAPSARVRLASTAFCPRGWPAAPREKRQRVTPLSLVDGGVTHTSPRFATLSVTPAQPGDGARIPRSGVLSSAPPVLPKRDERRSRTPSSVVEGETSTPLPPSTPPLPTPNTTHTPCPPTSRSAPWRLGSSTRTTS